MYPLTNNLLPLLAISGLACTSVRGDDGIAQQAFAAQATAKTSSPDVTADTTRAHSDKIAVQGTATKPVIPRVATVKRSEYAQKTGINGPPGTLIHPQLQDAGVDNLPPRVSTRAQAEDYHIQQMY